MIGNACRKTLTLAQLGKRKIPAQRTGEEDHSGGSTHNGGGGDQSSPGLRHLVAPCSQVDHFDDGEHDPKYEVEEGQSTGFQQRRSVR